MRQIFVQFPKSGVRFEVPPEIVRLTPKSWKLTCLYKGLGLRIHAVSFNLVFYYTLNWDTEGQDQVQIIAPAPKKCKLMPLWPTGPLDVTVSFDSTWSKRGFCGDVFGHRTSAWYWVNTVGSVLGWGRSWLRSIRIGMNSKCTINHSG